MAVERVPAEAVVDGLKKKSDKIRQLAKAGYTRSEISKLLGIRYQHVRNVLLASGMPEIGRPKGNGSQGPPEVSHLAPQKVYSSFLLQAGFEYVGKWLMADGTIRLDNRAPVEPGVYAFSLDDEIVYIGLTLRGLQGRMNQYRRGNPRQKTSARINTKIKASLADGRNVAVLVARPQQSKWNELPINTSAGLEVGLIQMIRPAWNIQVGTLKSP